MSDEIAGGDAGFDSRSPNLDLHHAVSETFVTDDDLEGDADEVGIIEFDSGAIGTVVPQNFETCGHQIGIEPCGSLDGRF